MESDCRTWRYGQDITKRSRTTYRGQKDYTYRLAWIEAKGEIPYGYVLHHRCGNAGCINISHLELLPSHHEHAQEHAKQRGYSICPHSDVQCEDCKRAYQEAYYREHRERKLAYAESYYEEHREERLVYSASPERRAYNAEYAKQHRDQINAQRRERWARKKAVGDNGHSSGGGEVCG